MICMKKQKRRHKYIIRIITGLLLVLLLIAGIRFYSESKTSNPHFMKYTDFYDAVQQQKITQAVISEEFVYFQMEKEETQYYTDNPGYDQFREFLLLHDVAVTMESGSGDFFYLIMDIIFDIIFIAILGGAVLFVIIKMKKQFPIIKHSDCNFSQVAGMQSVKEDLMQLADLLKHPENYLDKGIRQPNGILFVGPPGNGKTLFARALAGEAGMNFIATKATDFQSMYMSIGPAKIKALFKKARKSAPCIIFIDEFDGLGEKRNYAGQAIDKENNRIVTALLNELDGFEQHTTGVLVVAATNNGRELDPALIRAGRFDRKYIIDNPDAATRKELLQLYLKGKKISEDIDFEKLANSFQGMSCAQIEAIINEASLSADAREAGAITLLDFQRALQVMKGKHAQEER